MRYIGFDVGGTKCAVSLGEADNDTLRLQDRVEFLTPSDWKEALDGMVKRAERMIAEHGDLPAAVGISCGGPLDAARGVVMSPPNLPGWDDVPIAALVRQRLGVPAFLENDANACALAEWRWGAGRGADNMAFLTFGTGLGAGLILNGRLYRGANGNAGELGHIRLMPFGPAGYGKEGSFEGFCSGGGIAQLAETLGRRAVQRGEHTRIAPGDAPISARDAARAAEQGDETAIEVFQLCGRMLGAGLATVIDILNPDRIVIGSIYTRCETLLSPAMWQVLRAECLPASLRAVQILPAALGERIGDYAALGVAEYGLRTD